jgi:hypothetical protein
MFPAMRLANCPILKKKHDMKALLRLGLLTPLCLAAQPAYVGSAACRSCHTAIYDR